MSKKYRFQMDTEVFVNIWHNHIHHPEADDWNSFVISLFERFARPSETVNINSLNSNPDTEGWGSWGDEEKYSFLSEKAYTKCMGIRKKVRGITGEDIPMPSGYLDRKGKTGSGRISPEDIAAVFGLKVRPR
jgi:hypothetical protein